MRSGYFNISGIGTPIRRKASRWALVGSASIGIVARVPAGCRRTQYLGRGRPEGGALVPAEVNAPPREGGAAAGIRVPADPEGI